MKDIEIKSSRGLHNFYKAWLAWAEGKDDTIPFTNYQGLCANTLIYLYHQQLKWNYTQPISVHELEEQFKKAELDDAYPFTYEEYENSKVHCSMHKNETRLTWVRARIEDGVKDDEQVERHSRAWYRAVL